MFDTVMLDWKKGLQNPHTAFTRDIVRNQPRHLRLDYVFWEYVENGQAVPLFGLEQTVIEAACGGTFTDLQALYDRVVWVDSAAEAESFVRDIQATMA